MIKGIKSWCVRSFFKNLMLKKGLWGVSDFTLFLALAQVTCEEEIPSSFMKWKRSEMLNS